MISYGLLIIREQKRENKWTSERVSSGQMFVSKCRQYKTPLDTPGVLEFLMISKTVILLSELNQGLI